ncbi:hypothetical protein ACP70R_019756 [Stipagrostis hirtigluma subsp. patula]
MGNKLVWRSSSTDDSHPEPIERKRKLEDHSVGQCKITACSTAAGACLSRSERHFKRRRPHDPFERLPEDLLGTILSKLPLKEVVRTCVLSKKWRHSWRVCPKLCFDGSAICGTGMFGRLQVHKFIDRVNAVLQQHHGTVVEELAVKFGFDPILVDHLNNWVSFAVLSKTKILALDLVPVTFGADDDRYTFPFELLDSASISRLQRIQLSFVKFIPPSLFRGFPNLRKLDLRLVHASAKDLQDVLSNCCKLEWLSMVSVKNCTTTKVEIHAINLATFVYKGPQIPIDLSKALGLENVNISFHRVTLEHVICALPNELSNMQSLTLRAIFDLRKMPYLIENPCKFSQMKHLQLQFVCLEDVNMSLVSLLRAAPSIETLEMHFSVRAYLYVGMEPLSRLPKYTHSHLKNARITGFVASKGQLEFLEHVAENAPALEVLTVDTTNFVVTKDPWEDCDSEAEAQYVAAVCSTAREHVEGKIPTTCCLRIL